jgi:mutator protein MutT
VDSLVRNIRQGKLLGKICPNISNSGSADFKPKIQPSEQIQSKRVIEVAAALIEEAGKFLVTQRPPNTHLALYWEFPGGKREPGETLEACLKREILEELNVFAEVQALAGEYTYDYPDRRVILYFYRCRILNGSPEPKGCHDLKWVAPSEMNEADFPPADISIIQMLKGL